MKSEQEIIERLITLLKEQEDFDNEEVSWSNGEFNCYDPDDEYTMNRINSDREKMNARIGILQWVLKYQDYDDHVILAQVEVPFLR